MNTHMLKHWCILTRPSPLCGKHSTIVPHHTLMVQTTAFSPNPYNVHTHARSRVRSESWLMQQEEEKPLSAAGSVLFSALWGISHILTMHYWPADCTNIRRTFPRIDTQARHHPKPNHTIFM